MARKFLTPIDLGNLEIQNALAQNLPTASLPTPTAGLKGLFVYDTTTDSWKYCNGTTWVDPVGSGGPPTGSASGDLAGSYPAPTVKSSVALAGNPTTTTQAAANNSTRIATTAYADGAVSTGVGLGIILLPETSTRNIIQPSAADKILLSLKGYTSQTADLMQFLSSAAAVLAKVDSGGKGWFTGLDAMSQKITNVATPSASTDAVNKAYADLAATSVLLAPTSAARNVIAPTADHIGFTVKGYTGGTAHIQEWQLADGTVKAYVDSDGSFLSAQLSSGFIGTFFQANGKIGPYISTNGAAGIVVLNRTTASLVPFTVKGMAAQSGNLTEWLDSAAAVLAKVTSAGKVFGAGLDAGSATITNVADPSGAQDAATKAYVDSVSIGLDVKASCRVATTANITLSAPQTIDGVAVIAGDRVLVKNQTTASQNGLYVVAAGAWSRATDADTSAEVTGGMFTFVNEGTVNADSGWVLTTNDTITLGTTSLTFTQFSGAGQIVDGAAITKTGNTLDVAVDNSSIEVSSDALRVKALGITNAMLAGPIAYSKLSLGTSIVNGDVAAAFGYSTAPAAPANGAVTIRANTPAKAIPFKLRGDGATTAFVITHGLTNPCPVVQVYEDTTGASVEVDMVQTSTTITLTFAVAPAAAKAYTGTVTG